MSISTSKDMMQVSMSFLTTYLDGCALIAAPGSAHVVCIIPELKCGIHPESFRVGCALSTLLIHFDQQSAGQNPVTSR